MLPNLTPLHNLQPQILRRQFPFPLPFSIFSMPAIEYLDLSAIYMYIYEHVYIYMLKAVLWKCRHEKPRFGEDANGF